MNNQSKKRLTIVLIVFLVIINISALLTIFYNSKVKTRKIEAINIQKEEIKQSGVSGFFRNELNFSEEQFDTFKKINRTYAIKTRDVSFELDKNRHLLIEEIARENPNMQNVDSISRLIGNLHYQLKLYTSDHFLELKSICNEDQQKTLIKLFERMTKDKGD